MDDELEHTPWTPAGRQELLDRAAQLTVAIRLHAERTAAASGQADLPEIFAANEALLSAALEYADAQFDYTGSAFPFGALQQFDNEDDPGEDDPAAEGETLPSSGVSVLRRQDYLVLDEPAVLAAGQAAYLRVWPDDSARDASAQVGELGSALYQLAHAEDWDCLERVAGLRPVGSVVWVIDQDEPLGPDPDGWPSDPFAGHGEPLFGQAEVWAGPQ